MRSFGARSGFEVSEIGFGAWAIGGSWGADVAEETALDTLREALALGENFIDTADVYGGGRSESLIRKVLAERPEGGAGLVVVTKTGRMDGWAPELDTMRKHLQASRDRLGVERIQLVQLHCIPTETLKAGKVFGHLETLKAEGLIEHYGASVETIDEGLFCVRETNCVSLQVIFNLFRQRLVDELLPRAQAAGVGIIARVPLASGVLTGKFGQGHQFHPADHRNFNANGEAFNVGETFAGVEFTEAVRLAGRIQEICAAHGVEAPLGQVALRWILDFPEVSTVIPGGKTPAQVQGNHAAAALAPLPKALHAALREFYLGEVDAHVRGPY
jgi:aryl-alcohol dehydrogenase-like predicted oxidoreductase